MRHIALVAVAVAAVAALGLAACHSAGPYGHSVTYAPLGAEEQAVSGAREYDPVMFQRMPEEWRAKPTTLFGVVTSRGTGTGGGAYVALSVRRLEPRNLCENANDEDTCRVTVSDRDFGVVHAIVALRPEDDVGERSVGIGSLLRVVGLFGQDVDPNDASPVVRATYYRHWPRYTYVTRASAQNMRQ
jgi:hypothetical protein